jgi:hypothetical protein
MGRNYMNFRNAKEIKLIMVSVLEGKGKKDNLFRTVNYYCDFDGNVLFKNDSTGNIGIANKNIACGDMVYKNDLEEKKQ